MTVSFFTLCPCLLQDVPLLSSQVQMTPAAVSAGQAGKVASNPKANTSSFMNLNLGTIYNTYKSKSGGIQVSGFGESRESRSEMYSAALEEQVLRYNSIDDIALPDVFLHQYYSQVIIRAVLFKLYYLTWKQWTT